MNLEPVITQLQGVQMTAGELTRGTGDITGLLVLGLAFMDIVPQATMIVTLIWITFQTI